MTLVVFGAVGKDDDVVYVHSNESTLVFQFTEREGPVSIISVSIFVSKLGERGRFNMYVLEQYSMLT